jgi:hypothetical protein
MSEIDRHPVSKAIVALEELEKDEDQATTATKED